MADGHKADACDVGTLSSALKHSRVNTKPGVSHINYSTTANLPNTDLPVEDLNTLRFFYNLGIDYFRQCVRLPPPNLLTPPPNVLTVNSVKRVTNSNVHLVPRPPAKVTSHIPSAPVPVTMLPQASCLTGQDLQCQKLASAVSDDDRSQSSICQLQPITLPAVRMKPTQNVPPFQRRFSEPANRAVSSNNAISNTIGERDFSNDDDEEEILKGQKSLEFEDYCDLKKVKPSVSDPEISSLSNMTTGRASQDSGWTSDVSSTGDVSPTTGRSQSDVYRDTVESPDQLSVFFNKDSNGQSTDDVKQVNDDHKYTTNNCFQSEKHGTVSSCEAGELYYTKSASQPSTKRPSVPAQPRQMKEIPIRFRKLLEAENERIATLCKRLQGLPLIGHSQPSLISHDSIAPGGILSTEYEAGEVKDRSFECQKLIANDHQSSFDVLHQQQTAYLPPPYQSCVPISYCQELVGCEPTSHIVACQSPSFSQGSYRWPDETRYQGTAVSNQSEIHQPVNSSVTYYQNESPRYATLSGYPAQTTASQECIQHQSSLVMSPAPLDKPRHHSSNSDPLVSDVCYYTACYQPAYLPCLEVASYYQLQQLP